jgi:hypothetical protein
MIKYFCDCCGKEISGRGKRFSWYYHLTDTANGKIIGYVDDNGQGTSGREDAAELCSKCYNKIVILSVKEFFKLKNT